MYQQSIHFYCWVIFYCSNKLLGWPKSSLGFFHRLLITNGYSFNNSWSFEQFLILVVTKKAAKKKFLEKFLCLKICFIFFWGNKEEEWLDHTVGMFKFLRNWQTAFQNGCTILHIHHCKNIPMNDTIWFFRIHKEIRSENPIKTDY